MSAAKCMFLNLKPTKPEIHNKQLRVVDINLVRVVIIFERFVITLMSVIITLIVIVSVFITIVSVKNTMLAEITLCV
jgi:hypothetical protein